MRDNVDDQPPSPNSIRLTQDSRSCGRGNQPNTRAGVAQIQAAALKIAQRIATRGFLCWRLVQL